LVRFVKVLKGLRLLAPKEEAMTKLRISLVAAVVVVVLLASAVAWAFPAFLKTFTETYKPKPDSALGKASCGTCHISKIDTSKLNPYGQDLKKVLVGGKVTKASLAKVENLDSDKDGVSNIKEIKAGTLPGDPKSK
jgi:hypothetical protein